MDHEVDRAPGLAQRGEGGGHLAVLLDLARQHQARAGGCRQRPDAPLEGGTLIGECQLGTLPVQRLRDAPSGGVVVGPPPGGKSVVSGKSASVRVYLEGRRSIKKKTN